MVNLSTLVSLEEDLGPIPSSQSSAVHRIQSHRPQTHIGAHKFIQGKHLYT